MANNEQRGSFIPKSSNTTVRSWEKPASNILIVASLVVLGFSLLFWGVAFGYNTYLQDQINRQCPEDDPGSSGCGLLAELERYQAELSPEELSEIRDLDVKLGTVSTLVDRSRRAWPVFEMLNEITLDNIQFDDFSLEDRTVVLDGVGRDYIDVAIQARAWSEDERIRRAVIESANRGSGDDRVNFRAQLEVAPELLSYDNS